jgi:uncharacterized protein
MGFRTSPIYCSIVYRCILAICLAGIPLVSIRAQVREVRTYHDPEQQQLKEVYSVTERNPPRLTGPYISYYPNGNVNVKGHYSNNVPSGTWEYYSPEGLPRMTGEWQNNKRNGLWKFYHENASLKSIGHFTDVEILF